MSDLKLRLTQLIRERAYKEGKFILTSGQESSYYVDMKNVTLWPEGLDVTLKLIAEKTKKWDWPEGFLAVAGPTLGADPLTTGLSLYAMRDFQTTVPALILRKEPKKHGTSLWIEGIANLAKEKSKPILLVEDVVTTGGSSVKSIEILKEAGFVVRNAVCVLDREQGGRESMAKIGVELESLVRISEIQSGKNP